jgi:hypothetical protein
VLDNKPVQANIRLTIEADDIAARLSDGQLSGIYGQIKQFAAPIQADGTFRIPLVPEGNYRVQIEKIVSQRPGLVSMAQAYLVDIRQGNVSVLEDGVKAGSTLNEPLEILFKSGGGGVAGAVAGARDVMAGATVILVPQGDRKRINEFYRSSDTDAQGRFVFSEVAPGAYHAFALDKANLSGDTKLLYNPELTAPLEPMGIAVTVADGTTSRVDLSLIKTIAGR